MKTKIGTSFGFALLLALGVLATMLALGMFSAPKANAEVTVTNVTTTPAAPGANSTVTVDFTMDGASDTASTLNANADQINVQFGPYWTVPSTIAKERVTITTSQTTGGTSNPAVDPAISVDGATGITTVTLTVGDTNPSLADNQNLHPQAVGVTTPHLIVFSPLAGISNPVVSAADSDLVNWIRITTTRETTLEAIATANSVTVARTLALNSVEGTNGASVVVTGSGFTSGGTATVYLDVDADGTFNTGDLILATSSSTIAAGAFTATVVVNTTQFAVGTNQLNAFDGTGTISSNTAWSLIGSVSTAASALRGESIVITVSQFANGAVTALSIGGSGIDVTSLAAVGSDNTADYTVMVPTTTPLGTQTVSISVAGEVAARTTTIDVVGAPMTLSPSTAVAEQSVTVSGSGFTTGATSFTMTIQGTAIPATNINGGDPVTADDSGNMVATVIIPIADSTTITPGSYELQVVDNIGRTGSATLIIPSRTITLAPDSSLRGSTVAVTGAGFPAALSVTLAYAGTTVGSATPDATGNFSANITVPTSAVIPSANTVLATSSGTGTPNASATHSLPGATITVTPATASPGTTITVSATGFPGFATMTALSIGGLSVIPSPAPSSDADGVLSATALVPALGLGTQAVQAMIGRTTGTTSIILEAAPVVPVVTTQTPETLFATEIAADTLVRVFRFDNATKAWGLFDPRPAFAAANSYTAASSGHVVWVNFTVDTVFQGTTYTAGWNLLALQ